MGLEVRRSVRDPVHEADDTWKILSFSGWAVSHVARCAWSVSRLQFRSGRSALCILLMMELVLSIVHLRTHKSRHVAPQSQSANLTMRHRWRVRPPSPRSQTTSSRRGHRNHPNSPILTLPLHPPPWPMSAIWCVLLGASSLGMICERYSWTR